MTLSIQRVALLFTLLVGFFSLALYAQDNQMGDKGMGKTKTVTGCLQKGMESGGYMLAAEDGKVWELTGKTASLDKHIGHKVAVTGTPVSGSAAEEKKMKDNEDKEVAGKEHGDLKVSSVKHISETCP